MRTFIEILKATDHDVRAYSGRGMGGNECLGVSVGCLIGQFVADVMVAMEAEEIDVVADAFRKMREDSLGRGTIVYFPGIAAE